MWATRRELSRGSVISLRGVLLLVLPAALALVACGGSGPSATSPTSATAGEAAASPTPASPASSSGPGTIAFTKVVGAATAGGEPVLRTDIFTVRTDGTGLTRLTRSGDCSAPAWSPDGRRIAYMRQRREGTWRAGVLLMDADGSGRQFVTLSQKDLGPGLAWSPGGTIVYCEFRSLGSVVLFDVEPDSRWSHRVTPRGRPMTVDAHPARSPDGRILFTRDAAGEDRTSICSVAADGSDLTVVTRAGPPALFSLSPDGGWLLLWDGAREALVRVAADGRGEEAVLLDGMARYVPGSLAVASSWSPDGRRFAFASGMGQPSGLYVADADGSHVTQVPGVTDVLDPAWRPE